ncbi:hypothetical protein EI94DRAFT_1819380 [Lactarius quietus]|nr:hypothetical protein EI94DRAFT_1819380 [Lactarius quietus]
MSGSQGAFTPGDNDNNDNDGVKNDLEGDNNNNSDTAITGKEYMQQQFWNYVDNYLEYIRTVAFADIQDSTARTCKIVWFFNKALQVDIYNYRGGSKIPLKPSSDQPPMWQQILHRSAHWD